MGVKFSQLPDLDIADLERDDKLAILDASTNTVKKISFRHDSESRTPIGGASSSKYGHVMLSNIYTEYVGDADNSVGASQQAVNFAYEKVLENLEWYRKTFIGTYNSWMGLSDATKREYDVIILKDI